MSKSFLRLLTFSQKTRSLQRFLRIRHHKMIYKLSDVIFCPLSQVHPGPRADALSSVLQQFCWWQKRRAMKGEFFYKHYFLPFCCEDVYWSACEIFWQGCTIVRCYAELTIEVRFTYAPFGFSWPFFTCRLVPKEPGQLMASWYHARSQKTSPDQSLQ